MITKKNTFIRLNRIKTLLSVLILFNPVIGFSQDTLLTLQKAIDLSLTYNFDIRIAYNVTEQSKNNNTIGNAGMLPDVDANGMYLKSTNNLKQKYSNGSEVDRNGSGSESVSADAGLTWTIFDGLRMFVTKKKLAELSLQSTDQLRIQIENTLEELISAYYSIVRQIQLLKAVQEEIKLSEESVIIAERKMNNGSGSRLEWLAAKTENNRQRSQVIVLKNNAEEGQNKVNRLLGRKIETAFSVEDTVIITYKPSFEDLKKSVIDQNNVLSYYRRNQQIANFGVKEAKSLRSPIINLNTQYYYSKTKNDAGFTLLNQNQGFNYGATAVIPIFHGFNINRQIKNSKLDLANAQLDYESAALKVNEDLYNAFREFTNSLELLQIEEQNIGYAREVLFVAHERYRVGVSNAVEQLAAQRIFEDAMLRLADARYSAKISETKLRKVNGELIK